METYIGFYYNNATLTGIVIDIPPGNRVLTLDDATAFLNKIIVDDKFLHINNINIRVFMGKKNLMVKGDLFNGFQLYLKLDHSGCTYDGPLKDCSLFNAETITIISDHHDKTIANINLRNVMNKLRVFLKNQTSYDNVVQYEQLLSTLESLT